MAVVFLVAAILIVASSFSCSVLAWYAAAFLSGDRTTAEYCALLAANIGGISAWVALMRNGFFG